MREIDALGGLGEGVDFSAGVVVALFEGGEGGCRVAFEVEGGGEFGPVDFGGGGALESMVSLDRGVSRVGILRHESGYILRQPSLRSIGCYELYGGGWMKGDGGCFATPQAKGVGLNT